jgi:hypothetical protein
MSRCEIRGSQGGDYEDSCLQRCDTMQSGRSLLCFRGTCYYHFLNRRIRLLWEKVVLIVESRLRIGSVGELITESGIRRRKGKKVDKRR